MFTNPTGVAPNTTWRALVLIRATPEAIGEVSEQVERPSRTTRRAADVFEEPAIAIIDVKTIVSEPAGAIVGVS